MIDLDTLKDSIVCPSCNEVFEKQNDIIFQGSSICEITCKCGIAYKSEKVIKVLYNNTLFVSKLIIKQNNEVKE